MKANSQISIETTYHTMPDIVYSWLRNEIINGEYVPGTKISQEKIANALGVSRMPVREAIRRLQVEGLITNTPHKGAVVTQLTNEEIEELYDIRLVLETLAIRLAIQNITNEELMDLDAILAKMDEEAKNNEYNMKLNRQFHMTIYAASKRKHLLHMLSSIWNTLEPYRHAFTGLPGRISTSLEHHRCILVALKNHNLEEAIQYTQAHLKEVTADIHDMLHNTSQ